MREMEWQESRVTVGNLSRTEFSDRDKVLVPADKANSGNSAVGR